MTPALRSRLEAERMFTAADIKEAAYAAFYAGAKAGAHIGTGASAVYPLGQCATVYAVDIETEALARVRAYLSSDTTRIRPKRQA